MSKVAKSGFYIILFLCIMAIGISGYVMFLANDAAENKDTAIDLQSSLELPFPIESGTDFDIGEQVIAPEEPKTEEKAAEAPADEQEEAAEPKTTVPTIAETSESGKKAESGSGSESATESGSESEPESEPEKTEYTIAVSGSVTAPFSGNELVKSETMGDWRIHSGVDIAAELGTPVVAIADGVVSQVATDTMMGNVVKVEHADGLVSVYANLEDGVTLKVGDKLSAGDTIGKIGATALAECLEPPHLHLEVLKNGENIDPLSLFPAGEE